MVGLVSVLLLTTLIGFQFLMWPVATDAANGSSEWSPPTNFSEQPELISTFPVLVCDHNQSTHAFWVERDGQQAVVFYKTDTRGEWSVPTDIIIGFSINYLRAALGSDDSAHLLWLTSEVRGDLVYTQAPLHEAADSRSWQPAITVANGVWPGDLYVDSRGVLHVVYGGLGDADGFRNLLYYMRSEDNGVSWSTPRQAVAVTAPEPSSISGSIAADDGGRLHVAWEVRSNEYAAFSELGYARSVDNGVTWGSQFKITTGSGPFGAAKAGVFALGPNEIHLTWDTPDRMHKWSSDGGETWSEPVQIMDLGAAFGGYNELAKDSAGTIHVIAATGDGIFHATWNGLDWNPREAIDTRAFDPHGQQLVVCQGNRLHVVYYDRTGENEIWYSSMTTDAPGVARTSISPNQISSTRVPPTEAAHPVMTMVPATAGPAQTHPANPESARVPSSSRSGALTAVVVGGISSGFLLIGLLAASLMQRRRSSR